MKIEKYILENLKSGNYEIESSSFLMLARHYYVKIDNTRVLVVITKNNNVQVHVEYIDYDEKVEIADICKEIEAWNFTPLNSHFILIKTDDKITGEIAEILIKTKKEKSDTHNAMQYLVDSISDDIRRAKNHDGDRFEYLVGGLEVLLFRAENFLMEES